MTNTKKLKQIEQLISTVEAHNDQFTTLNAKLATIEQNQIEILTILQLLTKSMATRKGVQRISSTIQDTVKPFFELVKVYIEKQRLLEKELQELTISLKMTKN